MTIVHRDRDFMSDAEVGRLKQAYNIESLPGLRLFITQMSDMEAYFATPEHISHVTGLSIAEEKINVEAIVQNSMMQFAFKFKEKRDEVKRTLYKRDPNSCPTPDDLAPGGTIQPDKAVGKLLYKKLCEHLQGRGVNGGSLRCASPALVDPGFQALLLATPSPAAAASAIANAPAL